MAQLGPQPKAGHRLCPSLCSSRGPARPGATARAVRTHSESRVCFQCPKTLRAPPFAFLPGPWRLLSPLLAHSLLSPGRLQSWNRADGFFQRITRFGSCLPFRGWTAHFWSVLSHIPLSDGPQLFIRHLLRDVLAAPRFCISLRT